MTRRHFHYEAAFEDFLRSRGLPYIGVDEAQRAIFSGAKIKSFDFLVYPASRPNWMVDIKGRRFPYNSGGSRRFWENWVTAEDLQTLQVWEDVLGEGFRSMFVFAYALGGSEERWPTDLVHLYREQAYAFMGVPLADYRAACKRRSQKWGTVNIPTARFRELAKTVHHWWGLT